MINGVGYVHNENKEWRWCLMVVVAAVAAIDPKIESVRFSFDKFSLLLFLFFAFLLSRICGCPYY